MNALTCPHIPMEDTSFNGIRLNRLRLSFAIGVKRRLLTKVNRYLEKGIKKDLNYSLSKRPLISQAVINREK